MLQLIHIIRSVRVKQLLTLLVLAYGLQSAALHGAEQSWQINLKNADIRELITQIATITGRTFVIDPRVKGKVTVISNTALDEHAIYELFLSVLRVHGYAAVPAGDVVKIVQQTLAKQSGSGADFVATTGGEQLVTQVIQPPTCQPPSWSRF